MQVVLDEDAQYELVMPDLCNETTYSINVQLHQFVREQYMM